MRMIMLRTLMTTVDVEVAEASGLHQAYQTLSDLQPDYPDLINSMLCYPHTGPWLSHVLRRIASEVSETLPLWADCAYLGWLAAAASITCLDEGIAQVVIRGARSCYRRSAWPGSIPPTTPDPA